MESSYNLVLTQDRHRVYFLLFSVGNFIRFVRLDFALLYHTHTHTYTLSLTHTHVHWDAETITSNRVTYLKKKVRCIVASSKCFSFMLKGFTSLFAIYQYLIKISWHMMISHFKRPRMTTVWVPEKMAFQGPEFSLFFFSGFHLLHPWSFLQDSPHFYCFSRYFQN